MIWDIGQRILETCNHSLDSPLAEDMFFFSHFWL